MPQSSVARPRQGCGDEFGLQNGPNGEARMLQNCACKSECNRNAESYEALSHRLIKADIDGKKARFRDESRLEFALTVVVYRRCA